MLFIFYIIVACGFLYWAWNFWCDMMDDYHVEARQGDIVRDNIKFNKIRDFQESHDTSDKSKYINDFIQGEN